MADTIPFSAAYLCTLAFISEVTFKYNVLLQFLHFSVLSVTSSLASTIDAAVTNLIKEPQTKLLG